MNEHYRIAIVVALQNGVSGVLGRDRGAAVRWLTPGLASMTQRTENCAGLTSKADSWRLKSLNTQSCARSGCDSRVRI
jgi:hypothetical protein